MSAVIFRLGLATAIFISAVSTGVAQDDRQSDRQNDQPHCQDDAGEREASTPDSQFELPRDGTVIHRTTELQWAKCALGQTWSRESCTGQATSFRWPDANQSIENANESGDLSGYTDWRLPTRQELESIVERCRTAPAINTRIFPNTPRTGFWSSSLDTENDNHAWFVDFYSGHSLEYLRGASYRVRPVRSR